MIAPTTVRCGRTTPAGTHPVRPRHYRHTHVYRAAPRPLGVEIGDRPWRRCVCGAYTSSSPTTPERPESRWAWLHASVVLVHAWCVLRRTPAAAERSLTARARAARRSLTACRHAALLGVDAWHGWRAAPAEHEFTNGDGERLYLIRARRHGRPGWLCMTSGDRFGRWYPNLTGASGLERFWVGGTATWNALTGTRWAATTGGAGGASVPDIGDNVHLDANSGANTVTVGTGLTVTCRSLDCTGFTGTLSYQAGCTMQVGDGSGGAYKLVATMTHSNTNSCTLQFLSTSNNGGTGWGITTGGLSVPSAEFNGAGGKWVVQDAWTATARNITVTSGSLFTNGQAVSIAAFSGTGSTTRTVDITNSTITCATGITGWNFTTTTNLTFTSTGSTINMSNALAAFQGGGLSYGTVAFTSAGAAGFGDSVGAANTFVNLSYSVAAATRYANVAIQANQTVTGTLTIGGTNLSTGRVVVSSNTTGTQRTLAMTGAAVVISGDCIFTDIAITGSPSWTNSGSFFVGDALGNGTLITTNRTTPSTQTATGTASFTWSTHGWTSRVPLPQDTVVVSNAFIAGRTVNADMPYLGAGIDFTGGSGSPILSFSLSQTQVIVGSLTLVAGVTVSGSTATVSFRGRSSLSITSAGCSFALPVTFNAPGATYTLQDAFSCPTDSALGIVTVTLGTLDTGSKAVSVGSLTVANTASAGITLGTSTVTLFRTAAVSLFDVGGSSAVVSAASSTIVVGATSTNTRTFDSRGKTYGTLTYTVAGSTGQLTVTGGPTLSTINFSDATNARTLAFTAGTTTTITGSLNVNGTAGKLMSMVSTAGASAWTVSKTSGIVTVAFCSIQDSTATGGATFEAMASTSVSGNTGWSFNAAARTASDTATASDAVARLFTLARTTADSAPATDVAGERTVIARSAADSSPAVDAALRSLVLGRSASDSVSVNDVVTALRVFSRSASDAAPAVDTANQQTAIARATSDSAPASDTASRSATTARSVSDAAPAVDAAQRALTQQRSVSDAAPAVDAAPYATVQARSSVDSAPATDAVQRGVVFSRTGADAAPAVDAASRLFALIRTATDAAPAVDVAVGTRAIVSAAVDSAPATDIASRSWLAIRSASDLASAVDAASVHYLINRTAADSAPAVDVAVGARHEFLPRFSYATSATGAGIGVRPVTFGQDGRPTSSIGFKVR